ncbi:CRISPR-associated endonuclease Cas3'', partial [Kitasatospora griseola]|uniref:CRISPR-associated endonuclease Cas3'' n=1 Tax=Kitasatospora griseola TaxID=2064 RepID=UPI001671604A
APLWAHSRNLPGARHTLEDHLRGSASLARRFGSAFGAGELAEYLALIHDVGKGSCAWQHGLDEAEKKQSKVGVPHKEAGMWLATSHAGVPFGAVVQRHHGGLPELQFIARTAAVAPKIAPTGRIPLPAWLARATGLGCELSRDVLMRMLFSCVVDADFLNTSAHFANTPAQVQADSRL